MSHSEASVRSAERNESMGRTMRMASRVRERPDEPRRGPQPT